MPIMLPFAAKAAEFAQVLSNASCCFLAESLPPVLLMHCPTIQHRCRCEQLGPAAMPSAAAAVAAARPQDELYAMEEATLFNSLCLLEVQHAEGARLLDFSRTMFRKPNAKGLEFILHFVYATVKGKMAAKKFFRGVWPLIDKDRQQAKDFYQRAQDWLKEAGLLAAHGQSLVPFQRTPAGPKLVSFLLDLTEWALRVQHERLFPDDAAAHNMQDTPLLLALAEPLLAAARAQNQLQAQRLLAACQRGSQLQVQAEAAAGKLTELYYHLSAQLGEVTAAGAALPDDVLPPSCLADGGGNAALLPALQLPLELQAQLAELQQLWGSLERHLEAFGGLAGQVEALAGSEVHPHAIDGQQLRQAGQLPEAPCTAGLDIAAMMEAWLADVAGLCGHIRALAGQPDAAAVPAQHQQRTWGSAAGGRSSSGGTCAVAPTPLLASSDACSHAPHLYAQLGLHARCRDQMRSMRSSLSHQMAAAAERIQGLESRLFGLMEVEEQHCMAALAAQQHHDDNSMQLDSAAATAATAAAGDDAYVQHGHVGAGVFASSGLQLVPPTPLLQQLVQQHTAAERLRLRQQQLADGGGSGGADASPVAAPVGARLQQLLFTGGSTAQTNAPAAARSPGSPGSSHSSPLQDASSPTQQCAGSLARAASGTCSINSSGSRGGGSAGAPAAELLMTADLMDLDLVGSDDELYCHHQHSDASPGLLLATDSPLAAGLGGGGMAGGGSGLAGFEDLLRVSMLQLPAMAGAAAGGGSEPTAGAPSSSGGGQSGGCSSRSSTGGLSFRLAGSGGGGSSTAADGQQHGDDTPPWIGRPTEAAPQGTQQVAVGEAQPGPAAADGGGADDAAAGACSPLLVAPVLAAGQPLAPLTGSDCLSSARPRRLTFAAAVCAAGEDSGSASSALPAGSPGAGSCISGDDAAGGGGADEEVDGGDGGRAPSMLPSLRQRFASLMRK